MGLGPCIKHAEKVRKQVGCGLGFVANRRDFGQQCILQTKLRSGSTDSGLQCILLLQIPYTAECSCFSNVKRLEALICGCTSTADQFATVVSDD
ncbi:hypothetical protein L1887_28567 [Cichorium endivia]|nr:hypothetical protein L1887_28567 [Cichorium endivia]